MTSQAVKNRTGKRYKATLLDTCVDACAFAFENVIASDERARAHAHSIRVFVSSAGNTQSDQRHGSKRGAINV